MPPIFPLAIFFQTSHCLQTHFRGEGEWGFRQRARTSPLQGAVILSWATTINAGPTSLSCVWGESNHRMTSIHGEEECYARCIPIVMLKDTEVFSVNCQIRFQPYRNSVFSLLFWGMCFFLLDLDPKHSQTRITLWLTSASTYSACSWALLRWQRCLLYLLLHSLRHFSSRLTSSCHMI